MYAAGSRTKARRNSRASRGWTSSWASGCWSKYPGLSLVGGLAISFAIAVGAAYFEFMTQLVHPTLPLDDGHRVVGIRLWDAAAGRPERQASHDFVTWREDAQSVENLGAFRTLERHLVTGQGRAEPVAVAEISASAFRVARVPALLGRTLVEADEEAGAPPAVVVGYRVWQTRFAGRSDVVGQTVRVGGARSTVVGVMPEGFAFPVSHDVWVPLRLNVSGHERRRGPALRVFGRLAPGVTLDQARAELTTLGRRAAADFPDTHEHLRPEVLPYAQSILDVSGWLSLGLLSFNAVALIFLVLVCGNVALLTFARAATREREIVLRNALGASRTRILMQLFAEALVLASVAAAFGLAAAGFVLRWGLGVLAVAERWRLPFWFNDSLAPSTVFYAALLTVASAVIAGILPGLKVTGHGVQPRLQRTAAGGSAPRFGGLWTALIVTQVALTVVFPVTAFFVWRDAVQIRSLELGFPAEEYLSTRLDMDRQSLSAASAAPSSEELLARLRAASRDLEWRLAAEPGVTGVTFADLLPHMRHPQRRIEVDDGAAAPPESAAGYRVSTASVGVDFFEVLGTSILSGRGFRSGDLEPGARVVIVNQSFVREVLGDRNAIGRRLRYRDPAADEKPVPWYEIVGVVRDLGMATGGDPSVSGAGFYHPLVPGAAYPVHMAVHLAGDPESFTPLLRGIATAADPTLRLSELLPLDEIHGALLLEYGFWYRLSVLASSIAVLLSLAGIYSALSFTVSRQTREIGIRVALGCDPRRVVASIFRRPLAQVGVGVAVGTVLSAAMAFGVLRGGLWPEGAALVVVYAVLMTGVCLLACIVPTRRALRIEPTEALRADG